MYISFEDSVIFRGYWMFYKILRFLLIIIENFIDELGDLKMIVDVLVEELDEVEGIGEIWVWKIREGLKRLKE